MNRVYSPAFVGNDILVKKVRPVTRRPVAGPARPGYNITPNGVSGRDMASAWQASVPAAAVTVPNYVPVQSASIDQNSGQSPARLAKKRRRLLRKATFVSVAATAALASLVIVALTHKQQILAEARTVSTLVSNHKQPTSVKPVPGQIIIHTSDYNNALTALMTQQVTVNTSTLSHTVSGNTIYNWLKVKQAGAVTYISVNANQVTAYLTKLTTGNQSVISASQIGSATRQVVDNLLTAKGITLNL